VEPPVELPSTPTAEAETSQQRRQSLMTSLVGPASDDVEMTVAENDGGQGEVQRTLVLMARASFTTVSSLGTPIWLLLILMGFVLIFGRVTVGPMFAVGRRRTGRVGWFDPQRQFGYIVDDETEEQVFVHISHVRGRNISIADEVSYRTVAGERRSFARSVRRRETQK
jgi:CspA family cold shock protein